jgi:hypothetical protein
MWPRERKTRAILHLVDLLFQHMEAGQEVE